MQSRLATLYPDRIDEFERTLWLYPLAVDFWKELAGKLDEDVAERVVAGVAVRRECETWRR